MFLFEPIRNFYGRFERPISSLSLILGFVFDAFTLKRVDTLWENFLILGIFVVVNFLYFTNLIPPIPLSLKDAGIYHSIQKNEDGDYQMTYEDYGWRGYFKLYPDFQKTSWSPVYAFSAIFSPKGLNLTILHEWQYYNLGQGKWTTDRVINLSLVGGRDNGFRT